jgi:hypothetical protein
MPKHKWLPHAATSDATTWTRWCWGRQRKCRLCGAVQKYSTLSYDRLAGSTYGWSPRAGRCKGRR